MSAKIDGYKLAADHKTWKARAVSLDEWQVVHEWAKAENWDIGIGDAERFFNVDNQGFYLAYVNDQPVASVSVVNYTDEFSYAGFYLVAPGLRGKGYGLRLSYEAFHHCENRSVGLDGMPEQESNYKKGGFATYYETSRLVGLVKNSVACPDGVEKITEKNISDVIRYDEKITGYPRDSLLIDWFNGGERYGFVVNSEDGVLGIIGIRRSAEGYRLGPLYSESRDVLEKLFASALSQVPVGERVTIDAPTTSSDFIGLLRDQGYEEIFHTLRMYRGSEPNGDKEKVKAIVSLELG
jgi:GNAT superfamily N-acetyltransferase